MEAITITLDGVEVSGSSGMTVLDLARESGVNIPTLCHDPHLKPTGACRICLVEDERSGALVASCVTLIRGGMVINTHSPRVLERRKMILRLMLASHPDACLVCDKGNQCQLRKFAAEMGIGWVDLQRIPQTDVIEEANPFIERDLSKCIMCAKCIRADQELVVEGAIDYLNRGFTSRPATLNDLPLEKSECSFCGACVAMCPTGALREKEAYRGATTTAVDTVCPFCGCGCAISLEIKDNRVVRVRPSANSPMNRGAICIRGAYGYDFVHSPDRLLSPLLKVNGALQPASWEHALDYTAGELNRIKGKYGADSLAVLGSSKCTNEENYLIQRLARAVLGTNNIDNGSRLYGAATRVALGRSIGFPGTTSSVEELERSDVILVIGADPVVSAPVVGYAIKRAVKKGASLLLVDPRQTKLAAFARVWLKPEIGTDVALINSLARVIIDEKLLDEEFVTRRTDNFAAFEKGLAEYTPERVEALTSVPVQDIVSTARIFAGAERASIVYGNGITQVSGVEGVTALANLAMLTGKTEYHRGGVLGLLRENNAQGSCDMGGLPDFLPGYQSITNTQARKDFEKRWGAPLPTNPGLTALEMIEQALAGKIKGMVIVAENPVLSFPHPSAVRKALISLEFLVVIDMFPTETAQLATMVLPAVSFAEKEGTFTNFEGRVQTVRKALQHAGDSLPDWEIIVRLATKLGHRMPYTSPGEVMDEIKDLVPLYQTIASVDFAKEDMGWADVESTYSEARRLYRGSFPSGFERFSPTKYLPRETPNDYPFTLICGSILHQFGSGTRSSRASRLKQFSSRGWVEVGSLDAERLGFKDGDSGKVISPAGEITATVRINNMLSPNLLFVPISFPDCPINELFDTELDPQTRSPAVKTCAVRLERTDNNA